MPLIPFVKNGFFGSKSWVPLVNGNGLTTGGGDDPTPPAPSNKVGTAKVGMAKAG